MEPADLLATVPVSSAELATAANEVGLDAPVPTCPDWTVEQLVTHVGRVMRLVGKVVETGGPFDAASLPPPPGGPLVVQWFEEMTGATVAALAAKDPNDALWNWANQAPVVAFWYRRMAHEVAIHGVDAGVAAGRIPTIEPTLAADGIDELLTVILPAKLQAGATDLSGLGTLHIHCTDTQGEWLLQPTRSGIEVTRTHAKGDAALRGLAVDLFLRLSNRGSQGDVVGDPGVLAGLTERFRF